MTAAWSPPASWRFVRLQPGTKAAAHPRWQHEPVSFSDVDPRSCGVHVGASGLLVIDEDDHGAVAEWLTDRRGRGLDADAPPTLIIETASGKHHAFYSVPESGARSRIGVDGRKVDVLAGLRYVVAPGAVVVRPDGTTGAYRVVLDLPVATAPAWLVALVAEDAPSSPLTAVGTAGDHGRVAAALADEDTPACKAVARIDVEMPPAGRYATAVRQSLALARLAEQGHRGAGARLAELRDAYDEAIAGERETEAEFARAVAGAVAKVAAVPTPEADRGCCRPDDALLGIAALTASRMGAAAVGATENGAQDTGRTVWGAALLDGVTVDSGAFFGDNGGFLAASLRRAVVALGPVERDDSFRLRWYDAGVWRADGDDEVTRRVAALLDERFAPAHVERVRKVLTAQAPTLGSTHADPAWLNLPNGMLRWRDGVLAEHAPEFRSLARIPIEWDASATCPRIRAWMADVLGPEAVDLAFEVMGYALYDGLPIHRAVMLYGSGRNGKSTFLRLLEALVGKENTSSVTPQSLDENRFAAADLHGKLLNTAGDVDPKTFRVTERFKMITGDDSVRAERKHGQPFDFRSHALVVASFNRFPRSADTTEGFFSRWVVLPFERRVFRAGVADPTVEPALHRPAELRGLLVEAVAGLRRLLDRGAFAEPSSVVEATARFKIAADPVRSWLAETCSADGNGFEPRALLHRHYIAWCRDNGHHALGAAPWREAVKAAAPDVLGVEVVDLARKGVRGLYGLRHDFEKPEAPTPGEFMAGKGADTAAQPAPGIAAGQPRNWAPGVQGVQLSPTCPNSGDQEIERSRPELHPLHPEPPTHPLTRNNAGASGGGRAAPGSVPPSSIVPPYGVPFSPPSGAA